MKYDSSQFSSLINTIGNACDNKNLELVIDALSVSIANVGVSNGIPYEEFLQDVLKTITSIYVINDLNQNIDGDAVH
jgi:hypothetical protein